MVLFTWRNYSVSDYDVSYILIPQKYSYVAFYVVNKYVYNVALAPILSQMNQVYALFKIHVIITTRSHKK
jgi:hypothetical protein